MPDTGATESQAHVRAPLLTPQDIERWQAALHERPDDSAQMVPWLTRSVKPFFPFARVLLLRGQQLAGHSHVTQLTSHGHSGEYLKQLALSLDLQYRGTFAWWLINRRAFCFDLEDAPVFATQFELDEMREFGLGRVAAHGVIDPAGEAGSYFRFAGLSGPSTEWNVQALTLLVPALNELYLRHVDSSDEGVAEEVRLTPRQVKLLALASRGMSISEIARELRINERAVRDRLDEIHERLRSD